MGDMINIVYKNESEPIEARVKDLLSRMTLKEKLGQMTQIERSVATPEVIRNLCIGSVLSGGGSKPFDKATSADWADMVDGLQKGALESRLGIPIFYGSDAVHGNNNVYGTTIFPHNVGLGATRLVLNSIISFNLSLTITDPDLVERIGAATALETRASGVQYAFAPCVAVCKDPRWGRCYESYSEDTQLVRKMTSLVTGLQGKPPQDHPNGYPYVAGRNNVMACAKHYVGDGGTDKGKNEGNTIIAYEDLEKIHMLPYPDCISKGVCTVMASYSSWNGTKLHAHHWEALDRFSDPHGSNYRSAVLSAVNAGIDMVMVPFRYQLFLEDLEYLVESGEVPMTRIDDAVERILRVKFAAKLFEYPTTDRSLLDIVGSKPHRELAREAVRKSLVLLKNGKDPKKPFLPLDRNAKRVLVAGKHADDLGYQCGGWTATWEGTSGRITIGTTILDAVREAIGENAEVVYEENPTTESLSGQDFSYAIVAVGEAPYVESGGDNSELTIPFKGDELLKLVAAKIPTLAILISGRPLLLEPSLLETLDALVAAWLPGTEGNGITDVVFGDYEFHGRLPFSWFKSVDQLPMDAYQTAYDPLFPLGYDVIDAVYRNANEPIESRVKDLLSRMTIKEKLGQMTQIKRSIATPTAITDLGLGSILSGGGSKPFENATSLDWAEMVDGFQKAALESRLGIPMFYGSDAIHGNNNVYGTTIFPHNIGLGATRDPDLIERIGAATALETRASGVQYAFAPCLAVCKDPRWGRYYESYGEDTELVRKMTTLGIPSSRIRIWRTSICYHIETVFRRVLARLWRRTRVGTEPNCTPIGIVISDWEGIDRLSNPRGSNYRNAVSCAINAGIDMVMVPTRYELFLEDLAFLVESGEVPMSRIDDAVERILRDPRKPFLPLDRNAKRVLVAGKHADDLENPTPKTLSLQDFSYAIVVVGEAPYSESRGDNPELTIPFEGDELLKLVASQIPTLAILISGRPLVLEPSLLERLDALVAAWLPGTEGNGITDVIFGDYEFRGQLPVSWFRSVDQLPMDAHEKSYDPLFPLGYGLKSRVRPSFVQTLSPPSDRFNELSM
ncbi:Glycoside hydrolase family 3 [Cynara cardunculus var. scolymus]|uniref:Glycoside hydrolase family 3 n=1 Tax=Cynara cardunculus var. scolymus TaxID=59895 RepID=A0A124SFM0_CYNCS|nr:Glycoside hydrolase family 3 [Cynara cardunculus var. scolymus]